MLEVYGKNPLEDKADTVLSMWGEEIIVREDTQTQAESKLLYPMLSYGPAESVCRGYADFRSVTSGIGTEAKRDEIGRIVVCASAHLRPSLDARIVASLE